MKNDNPQQPAVLISGGASGIGRAIAKSLLDASYIVHVCDASPDNIADFLQEFPHAHAMVADVSDAADVEKIYARLDEYEHDLGVLVNNAGVAGPVAGIEEIDIEEWQQCIDVNLNGPFYLTRLAVPRLKARGGGSIINIASGAALFGCPSRSPYVAGKWGLVGLTKTWAMELGRYNIRVNAICPGSVDGDRIDRVIKSDADKRGVSAEEVRNVYLRQSSMRTFISPDDVAQSALFLTSAAAAKISGQILAVDGHTEGLTNWLDE